MKYQMCSTAKFSKEEWKKSDNDIFEDVYLQQVQLSLESLH